MAMFNKSLQGGKYKLQFCHNKSLQVLLETYKLSFKTYNACLNFFGMFKQGISFEMVVLQGKLLFQKLWPLMRLRAVLDMRATNSFKDVFKTYFCLSYVNLSMFI